MSSELVRFGRDAVVPEFLNPKIFLPIVAFTIQILCQKTTSIRSVRSLKSLK